MPLELCNHREKAAAAVQRFRDIRELGPREDREEDVGPAGKPSPDPMGGFIQLIRELVEENGLPDATISLQHKALPRPGLVCPAKLWSLVVLHRNRLIAALDLKSHVDTSGANSRNPAADALGSAHDFWAAYREGVFGIDVPKPFLGWLILVDDQARATRYEQLCKTLVNEQHYTAACIVHSRPDQGMEGRYKENSEPTGLTPFVADFAAHMAGCARKRPCA